MLVFPCKQPHITFSFVCLTLEKALDIAFLCFTFTVRKSSDVQFLFSMLCPVVRYEVSMLIYKQFCETIPVSISVHTEGNMPECRHCGEKLPSKYDDQKFMEEHLRAKQQQEGQDKEQRKTSHITHLTTSNANSIYLIACNLVVNLPIKYDEQNLKEEHLKAKQQQEAQDEEQPKADNTAPRDMATNAREASRVLQSLSSEQREQLLHKIADNLLAKEEEIMQENDKDCQVIACSNLC